MSALSDILDGIQVLVEPPTPVDLVTITVGGATTIRVRLEIRFDADDGIEVWSDDILQFKGSLNTTQTVSEQIQWSWGSRLFAFSKVSPGKWSATHLGLTGRGLTPEDALTALFS